ncbi:hypothetical protein DV737_g3221, partial [Chaetothyriales sp. CBS 132003]
MAQPHIEILELPSHGNSDHDDGPHDLPHHDLPRDMPDYRGGAAYHHRPSMEQHMPERDNYQRERRRSSVRQSIVVSEPLEKYVGYRLIKQGRSWTEAFRRKMSDSQSQLEKMAKKGRREVGMEVRNMGEMRAEHFDRLIEDLNAEESGDATWEAVSIKKKRVMTRDKIEVKSMEVVLERVPKSIVARAGASRIGDGELVVFRNKRANDRDWSVDKRANDRDWSVDKRADDRDWSVDKRANDRDWSVEKRERGGAYDRKRKDSKLDEDDDPFQSKPLFHSNGKPMDDYGPMNFDNAGLPPEIPRDRPIGSAPPKEKEQQDDEPNKGQKGPSKDKGKMKEGIDDHVPGKLGGDIVPVGKGDDDYVPGHKVKPRARSRSAGYHAEAMPGRRSRSRRRPSGSRARGSQSRSRAVYADEVRFPPGSERDEDWGDSSSVSSDRSRFGLDQVDGSSHTSQDTYQSVVGRGSQYYDDVYENDRSKSRGPSYRRERRDYNEYSRGPPLRRTRTDETYQPGGRARRYPMNGGGHYHDALPESRQTGPQAGALMRRATIDDTRRPIVHYPNEMNDPRGHSRQRATEGYINAQVRDEKHDRWERNLDKRERDIDRRDLERGYYDDNRRYSKDDDACVFITSAGNHTLTARSSRAAVPEGTLSHDGQLALIMLQRSRRLPEDSQDEPALADSEREAVADLLQYLENRAEIDFFSGEPLRALSTLVYSDNVELQRSASLTFAEITERDVREVDRETLEPILMLLQNDDVEVQRAASAALGNLAVNTENKVAIVQLGGLPPLIRHMTSPHVEVQCNAVGCITNLATHEDNKAKIARSGALGPLTRLAKSKDSRVQRNATGALLNMTHSDDNRQQLVNAGAIPVLVQLLQSPDMDVQYYCTTALSNIAVDASNRKKLAQTEPKLVQSLVQLMDSGTPRVQCQAALALRNLASDEKYQLEIVRAKGLTPLMHLLQASYLPLVLSAVACIRNISIHPLNESPIIDAGFLRPLVSLLGSTDNEEIQCHAISTLRNLAASSDKNKQLVLEAGAVQKCKELVLSVPLSVQSEMTAAIAVLALSDELKAPLLKLGVFDCLIPLTASESIEVQGNSAAALGNLSSKVGDYSIFVRDWTEPNGGIHGYLRRFLASGDATFQHIAIWTLLQLLESEDKKLIGLVAKSDDIIQMVCTIADKHIESDDEEGDEGEGEVVALAQRSLELLGKGPKQTLVEG